VEGTLGPLNRGVPRYTLLFVFLASACNSASPERRVPQWRAVEDTRFTSSALTNVADIEAGLSGTMYVVPADQPHVLVYRPEANGLVNTMTQGVTGTLARPTAVGSAGGLLWIFDDATQIAHLYQGSGAPVVVNDLMVRAPKPGNGKLRFDGVLRDASILARIWPADTTPGSGILLLRITHDVKVDTIAFTRPTATVLVSAVDEMIVIIDDELEVRKDSTGFRFTKINLVGDTLYSNPWYYRARGGPPRDESATPTHYSAAMIATDGSIHVGTGDPLRGDTRWYVFGMIGKPSAWFEVPRYARLHAAGADHVYGHHSTEQSILRFALAKR